jgi:class 3 adenylate cyclase
MPEDIPLIESARKLYSAGDALAAYDLLAGLDRATHSLASRQLLAASALRGGAVGQARELVQALLTEGHGDEETLGLAAKEAKLRWQQGEPGALQEARDAYLRAFRATAGLWTGINAATLSLVAGDADSARKLALEVLALWQSLPAKGQTGFWALATAAEASLILGEEALAAERYRQAVALAPRAFGNLRSVRDNAREILRARGASPDWMDKLFTRPVVAAFSGHMIDKPGRTHERFPARHEGAVAAAVQACIGQHQVDIGVCAAANGADILFLEALQAAGKETQIVLPCPAEEFRRISVTDDADPSWGPRFDRVMVGADQVCVVAPQSGEDLGYQFHGVVMAGTALLRADAVGGEAMALALWDKAPGGVGGTGSVVQEWLQAGIPVVAIPLAGSAGGVLTPNTGPASQSSPTRCSGGQRVVSLLFADAVGFSGLLERQVPIFMREFWGGTARLLEGVRRSHLLHANTWGDGLYLVFDDAPVAADCALSIGAMVRDTDWHEVGLPADIDIRIALHAGPAYEYDDPISGLRGYSGMHVSRAARIEPVTPPGQIYASEAFAALLAFDDTASRFRCEYVGTVPLAKSYGRMRTYRLVSRHGTAPVPPLA